MNTCRVGTMSRNATRETVSGWSRHIRWATRAPRSWLTTANVSWPSARISPTWSSAIARFEYDAWSAVEAGRDESPYPRRSASDDGELLGQPRRDPVPHHVGLRIAVQQQHRWTVTADRGVDTRSVDVDVMDFEGLEHDSLPTIRSPVVPPCPSDTHHR